MPILDSSQPTTKGVSYLASMCKKTGSTGVVTTNLVQVDGEFTQSLPPRESGLPKGCKDYEFTSPPLSQHAPDGQYYLQISIIYKVNNFRSKTESFKTEVFKIEL